MKMYPLGGVQPRFTTITTASNTNPIVVTTSAAHGYSVSDVITISSVGTNTAANGTYSNAVGSAQFLIPSPTTITLIGVAGIGAGTGGFASAPRQLITVSSFPVIAGVTDNTKILVARLLFIPFPAGTAPLYIGTSGMNQATFLNVARPVNPPPALGIFDSFDIGTGANVIPIADYWVDATKPGTEGLIVAFWIR